MTRGSRKECLPSAVLVAATMLYAASVTHQIRTLAELCREQRADLQKLTVTYQEKVVPALAEVDSLLRRWKEDRERDG